MGKERVRRGLVPPDLFSFGTHSVLKTQAEGFPGGLPCAKLRVGRTPLLVKFGMRTPSSSAAGGWGMGCHSPPGTFNPVPSWVPLRSPRVGSRTNTISILKDEDVEAQKGKHITRGHKQHPFLGLFSAPRWHFLYVGRSFG